VIAATVLLGLVLLAFPAVFQGRLHRLPAPEATTLASFALATGAALILAGLVLVATPTLLRTSHAAGVASVCEHALGPLFVRSTIIGWLSAGLALGFVVLAIGALRTARRSARLARVEPWLGEHHDHCDYTLVVVPTGNLMALSVPGTPPQVVVSRGLLEQLAPAEAHAVMLHEAAHLRLRHRRHLLLAAVIDRIAITLPWGRASCRVLRSLIEESADDVGAGSSPDQRRALASALAVIAGGANASAPRGSGQILTRWRRLERPSPRPSGFTRAILVAPAVAVALVALLLITSWFAESHHALALGAYCPD